jgi:hypothetical protein
MKPQRNEEAQAHIGLSSHTKKKNGIMKSRMRRTGQVALMGENKNIHRVLVGETDGTRPLGRPRSR